MAEKRYIEKLKINDWWYWFKPSGEVNSLKVDNEYLYPDGGVVTVPLTVDANGITYEKSLGTIVTAPSINYLLAEGYTNEEVVNFADNVFEEAWT